MKEIVTNHHFCIAECFFKDGLDTRRDLSCCVGYEMGYTKDPYYNNTIWRSRSTR